MRQAPVALTIIRLRPLPLLREGTGCDIKIHLCKHVYEFLRATLGIRQVLLYHTEYFSGFELCACGCSVSEGESDVSR